MKFIWYEDMKKDLQKIIRELSKFTGYHLTDYRVLLLDDHLYVDNFRKKVAETAKNEKEREMSIKFVRKGKVGDWKNHLSPQRIKEFDDWIEKNLEGTDIVLPKH